ncbi:MAG: hydroxysqualene dehydroxylase HpnE [Acetobacteraceae bacterium]
MTTQATVHVLGAGLAGLAAATALAAAGRPVVLYESGPAAGGRCRSYHDRDLELMVDNGNHLLLSGNRAASAYLARIGAATSLCTAPAAFPFLDLATGLRWTLRPNPGRIGWWVLDPKRRVPGTGPLAYLRLARLAWLEDDRSVAAVVRHDILYHRLVAPLAVAALNTAPETGLARLLGAVMRETLLAGGAACQPRLPRGTLGASLIDPAVAFLRARGAAPRFGWRVAGLEIADGRVAALRGTGGTVTLGPGDAVVMALPPWVAGALLPGLTVPDAFAPILNLHYRQDVPPSVPFIGLIGGAAEWVFVKPGHVSVTVSAAQALIEAPAEALAARIWPEVCAALGLGAAPLPAFRVVKEKRATIEASAAQEARRPGARTGLGNLLLAGDWTATGLPGTIEGAIRSGERAAALVLHPDR